jgi:hypothetical protein
LHVHGRSAKADASSRSFAVLSTQISTAAQYLGVVPARGAMQVLNRGEQAIARGAVHCLLHVLSRIHI